MLLQEVLQALNIEEGAIDIEPVEDFIEKAGIVPGDREGQQEQCLGVDNPGFLRGTVPAYAQCGPLPPQHPKTVDLKSFNEVPIAKLSQEPLQAFQVPL